MPSIGDMNQVMFSTRIFGWTEVANSKRILHILMRPNRKRTSMPKITPGIKEQALNFGRISQGIRYYAHKARIEAGENLCRKPGCENAPVNGKKVCQRHLDMDRKTEGKRKEYNTRHHTSTCRARRAEGCCPICGGEPVPGKVLCGYHGEAAAERSQARRQAFAASGGCAQCGKPRDEEGRRTCSECRRKNRERHGMVTRYRYE